MIQRRFGLSKTLGNSASILACSLMLKFDKGVVAACWQPVMPMHTNGGDEAAKLFGFDVRLTAAQGPEETEQHHHVPRAWPTLYLIQRQCLLAASFLFVVLS